MRAAAWLRACLLSRAPSVFARWCVPSARELGLLGEELAVRALCQDGCVIVGRRVRAGGVEVDIVARDERGLICAEVKTARCEPIPRPRGSALPPRSVHFKESGRVSAKQRARLARAARELARCRGVACRLERVDVSLNARSGSIRITRRPIGSRGAETRSRFGRLGPDEPV